MMDPAEKEIRDGIVDDFEVERDAASRDMVEFVESLMEARLIERVS